MGPHSSAKTNFASLCAHKMPHINADIVGQPCLFIITGGRAGAFVLSMVLTEAS